MPGLTPAYRSSSRTSTPGDASSLTPVSGVQAYTSEDEHKIVNIGGHPFEIKQRPVVAREVSIVEVIDDPDFRGFASRSGSISNPMADEWFFSIGAGGFYSGFENYDGNWRPNYDPFAAGEPWENSPDTAEVMYRNMPLHWDGRAVTNQAAAEAAATGVGEVFVLINERVVVYIDEFTAGSDGDDYVPIALVPTHFDNPTLFLWGSEQAKRIAAPAVGNLTHVPAGLLVSRSVFLNWKLEDEELFFDAQSSMVEILAAADAPADADILPATASERGKIFLKFLSGLWNFEVHLGGTNFGNQYLQGRMMRVVSGADNDEVVGLSSGSVFDDLEGGMDETGTPDQNAVVHYQIPFVQVAEDDVFYVAIVSNGTFPRMEEVAQWLKGEYHG